MRSDHGVISGLLGFGTPPAGGGAAWLLPLCGWLAHSICFSHSASAATDLYCFYEATDSLRNFRMSISKTHMSENQFSHAKCGTLAKFDIRKSLHGNQGTGDQMSATE